MERILIIGATSDMGQAFAHACALQGSSIMLAARNEATLERVANDLRVRCEVGVSTHTFDVLDMEQHEAFYASLPERPDGVICFVGVSSVAGDRGRAPRYHYGCAKAGLNAYLSGLRQRLFKSGVFVMNVKPGYCRTKMVAGWDLPAAMTSEPDEVARAILKALRRKQETLYVRWMWRWIMGVIRLLPEFIFKRLKI